MTSTEFKDKVSEIITFANEAEQKRFLLVSNKNLKRAGVSVKTISADKEVKEAWRKFNKHQADWDAYCRKSKHENRHLFKTFLNDYQDYSHLAYNGVTDDF